MNEHTPGLITLSFETRRVSIGISDRRGLFVFDPAQQVGLKEGKTRLYIAAINEYKDIVENFFPVYDDEIFGLSVDDAWLAHKSYASFLNPSIPLTISLANNHLGQYGLEIGDAGEKIDETGLAEQECYEIESEMRHIADLDNEYDLIQNEILGDQDSYTASNENGWFYED